MRSEHHGVALGERLATWLEELGLAPHLAEAGLPAFERDERGRAAWTDPGTGEELTAEELAELDAALHSEGEDPAYAVPVQLVQLAHRARRREELLASAWFDYASLAQVRGASLNATRFAVHKAASRNELLVLAHDERTIVPAFQLTDGGEPRDDLAPVLAPLLAAGTDPWQVWSWLTQPAALLGGQVPAVAAADPEEAGLVQHAAVRLAERAVDPSSNG